MKKKDGFLYEKHGNSIYIEAYDSLGSKSVTVPCKIDGFTVSHLGKNAFHGLPINSLTLPDTISYISPYALYGCYSLREINIIEKGGTQRFYRTLKTAIAERSIKISGAHNTFRLLLSPEDKARAALFQLLGADINFPEEAVEQYFKRRYTYVLELAVKEDSVPALISAENLGKITSKNIDLLIAKAQESNSNEALAHLLDYKQNHFGFSDIFSDMRRDFLKDPFAPSEIKKRFSIKAEGDFAMVNGYNCDETDVFIPERVGKRAISKIAPYAFSPQKKRTSKPIYQQIKKVDLNKVSNISEGAFAGCSRLEEVSLKNAAILPDYCFSECSSLSDFDFSNITHIGNHAFEKCTSLKSAVLPEKLEFLGDWTFYGCSSLSELVLSKNISALPELSFARCTGLKEISLPVGVTLAGKRCFFECTSANHIDISSSVKKIDWEAFSGCSSIKSLFIPGNVKEVGNLAFYYCTGITELILAEGIESLEWGAFSNCQSLEVLHLPRSIKKIDSHVFKECYNLKEIHIPPEITNIHAVVFDDCRYVRIYGKKDSFAQQYAWIYGIPFLEDKTME